MGLDQMAYLREKESTKNQKEFYWRKHSRLQEFMEIKWEETGGDDVFNCKPLFLNSDDLIDLKKAINDGYKSYVCEGGFFWGSEFQKESVENYKSYDLEFVNEAIVLVENGGEVEFSCWW